MAGLVGPNGAGKTTLLHLAVGLLAPTAGTIEVAGGKPAASPAQLARVGFVAQDTPAYAALSVADHLRLGAHLNPGWDAQLAADRIRKLGLDPRQRAGKLSGGQRAQLALTLAIAKRPELLILDEPVASLDPLARREFLQDLAETVAGQGISVVLSPSRRPAIAASSAASRNRGVILAATRHTCAIGSMSPTTAPAGIPCVSAVSAGVSFSVKSTNGSDTAVVLAWFIVEHS